MEHSESQEGAPGPQRGRGLRSGLLAAGAAFGMMLAGPGIANAQIDGGTEETTSTTAAQPNEPSTDGTTDTTAAPSTTAPSTTDPTTTDPTTTGPTESAPDANQTPDDAAPDQTIPDGMRRGRHGGKGAGLAVAAQAIGISEADLLAALRDGQSIAQVAQSRNVDVQKVIDALVADARAHLAEHVQAGDITQAQADERAADLTAHLTDMVNRIGQPGRGHGPGRHGGGHRGARLSVAARAIGIPESELMEALRNGQSIAQVAGSENVHVQKVIDALVADVGRGWPSGCRPGTSPWPRRTRSLLRSPPAPPRW